MAQSSAIATADAPDGDDYLPTFPLRVKPVTALVAAFRLLLNKEDTKQMLVIVDAIDGPTHERNYRRFQTTPGGRRMVDDEVDFSIILMKKEPLRACPPGSLGAAYMEFTDAEHFDAGDLAIAEQQSNARMLRVEPSRRRFIASGIALHDIWHVLAGYGRDALGEACVLAFTATQAQTIGVGVFAFLLAVREQFMFPRVPVMRCYFEARRIAKAAEWLPAQDWRRLFEQPLQSVRDELHLRRPTLYECYAAQVREADKYRRAKLAAAQA
ncbi:MAG TPA: Coq4 family protein [Parvularculaceae bacterium]|nr:Coq4 family protein [Parvularculaceae bacterium]